MNDRLKTRIRPIRRRIYCLDTSTGSEGEARQFVEARNQARRQPEINLQIAKAYLAADARYTSSEGSG